MFETETGANRSGVITTAAYEKLITYCLEAAPFEACGILAASDAAEAIDIIHPIANVHSSPQEAFAFDPAEWTSVYFGMQKNRQQLVGLYHSHPSTAAVPSVLDKHGMLLNQEAAYWIISLEDRLCPSVQPYIYNRGIFTAIPLVLA